MYLYTELNKEANSFSSKSMTRLMRFSKLDPFLWARARAAAQADSGVAGAVAVAATARAGTSGAGRSLGCRTGCNSRSQPPAAGATSMLAAAAAVDG